MTSERECWSAEWDGTPDRPRVDLKEAGTAEHAPWFRSVDSDRFHRRDVANKTPRHTPTPKAMPAD